ncbi:unnamed protein product [Didymodactylos carnosus]|uniref:GIY-YIG domain-containing protein n=1 Tax=Didymodactylos carnosus TaxID=1234261 RepID=A0A8S2EQ82_9BILA|nr:unnamed protein product [Didymodactylos carnosus]CAF4018312.1 unnamed protein product [Didymodactylos carnosus]
MAVNKLYPKKTVRIVYDVNTKIGTGFSPKDPIPILLKSGLIYEAKCSECGKTYIGKTCRHLKTRVDEHLKAQEKIILSQTKLVPENISKQVTVSKRLVTTISRQGPVTRPQTSKIQRTVVKMDQEDLEDSFSTVANVNATNTATEPQAKSAIAKHYKNTGHVMKNSDFRIILSEQHKYRLLVKESLLIRSEAPVLNGTDRSVPLYVFPDGVEKKKTIGDGRFIPPEKVSYKRIK